MGGYLPLEFQRHAGLGVLDLGFPQETDKSVFLENANFMDFENQFANKARTDDTADYHGSRIQDKHRSIRCVRVHLQKKTNKPWVVHQAPEALSLMNFLSD